jgi:hypothetical protein
MYRSFRGKKIPFSADAAARRAGATPGGTSPQGSSCNPRKRYLPRAAFPAPVLPLQSLQ